MEFVNRLERFMGIFNSLQLEITKEKKRAEKLTEQLSKLEKVKTSFENYLNHFEQNGHFVYKNVTFRRSDVERDLANVVRVIEDVASCVKEQSLVVQNLETKRDFVGGYVEFEKFQNL